MTREKWVGLVAVACALSASLISGGSRAILAAQGSNSSGAKQAPIFEVEPFSPKPLPHHWVMGSTIGLSVDAQDHVWVIHRPQSVDDNFKAADMKPPIGVCCSVAPPVLEFDQEGNLVGSWEGPGQGYEWPVSNHGITVGHKPGQFFGVHNLDTDSKGNLHARKPTLARACSDSSTRAWAGGKEGTGRPMARK